MDDQTRAVAWAIAQAWWRKTHRQSAGSLPEATSSDDYADKFWQEFSSEAIAAISAVEAKQAFRAPKRRVASDRFA